MLKFKLCTFNNFVYYLGSLGQLVQTPGSPSRNNIGNTSGHGGFSIMTPSSSNAPGPVVSSQLSGPSHQITPSVIGKSNHPSKYFIFIKKIE